MGSIKVPRLSEAEIVARYVAGEGRTMLALRAKMPDAWVREVLVFHGVELRTHAEATKAAGPRIAAQRKRSERRFRERRGQC
jgi:hypothetical protein